MKRFSNPSQILRLSLVFCIFLQIASVTSPGFGRATPPILTDTLANQPAPSKPVVARIYYPDQSSLDHLASQVDIWEVHPDQGYILALLSPEKHAALIQAGYRLEIDSARTIQVNQPLQSLPGQTNGIPNFPCYRTIDETYASLSALAANHPNLATWTSIGNSWDKVNSGGPPGYSIFALVITNQAIPGPKPVFLLMAETHARELATAELATRFAEYLISQYDINADITWLVDHYEIHVIPMSNPDGRKWAQQGYAWRKNTDNFDGCNTFPYYGTDLNRNYSFHWGQAGSSNYPCDETYHGQSPSSEPEVQAIQNYILNLFPDQRGPGDEDPAPVTTTGLLISLHSYGGLVLWPYGYRSKPAPNDSQLQTLGRKIAFFNGYTPEQSYYLYVTSGDVDDWTYGQLGVAAYTIELGTDFFQNCSDFENKIYPQNLNGLLHAAKDARRPYQNPSGPDSIQIQATPDNVIQGFPLTLIAIADDRRFAGGESSQVIQAARLSIDAPSWITRTQTISMTAADGSFDNPIEQIQGSLETKDLLPGRHTVFIESQDNLGNWGVPSAIFVWVKRPYDLAVAPLSGTGYGVPGETITYSLKITNTGGFSDTYSLVSSGNHWPIELPVSPVPLDPGRSISIPIIVHIPADAPRGTGDITHLQVTSVGDPTRKVYVILSSWAGWNIFLPVVK
jgi:carboxypeptidase T